MTGQGSLINFFVICIWFKCLILFPENFLVPENGFGSRKFWISRKLLDPFRGSCRRRHRVSFNNIFLL